MTLIWQLACALHLVSDICFNHPMVFAMASKDKVHPIHVIEVRSANEELDLEEVQETGRDK